MAQEQVEVACCIAGGGPAGMMLGLLLARAGVEVLVLEKHGDFLRDFRGDTIHPSTLEVMHELGLLEAFLKLPHDEIGTLSGQVGTEMVQIADFRHLPTHCKFVALMPQWDFLDFLAGAAKAYPTFRLRMQAEASALIEEGGRVIGLKAKTPEGTLAVRAGLVVAADGRHSTLRAQAGLEVMTLGAPMDVLWLRLSRRMGDPGQTAWAVRQRAHYGDAEPRQLLAMRLRHPQGRDRGDSRGGAAGISRNNRGSGAPSRRPAE